MSPQSYQDLERQQDLQTFQHNVIVIVYPSDPSEGDFCPESDDGRGTTWLESAADTIVSLECQTGFTGIVSFDNFAFMYLKL